MASDDQPLFRCAPDPAMPGWSSWSLVEPGRFNDIFAPMHIRRDADGRGRVRFRPGKAHSNLLDAIHGGALAAMADLSLFGGLHAMGYRYGGLGVTVDMQMQFLRMARIGVDTDAVVEVMRETGRLMFLRGVIEQGDAVVFSFSATIRKFTPPRTDEGAAPAGPPPA